MKLTTYTAKKGIENKLTLKGKTGSYKSTGDTHEVIMTFTLDDGEHLQDESDIAKEANEKVKEALRNLADPDPAWISDDEALPNKGYKVAK